MSINPPSDLLVDVAKAADPATSAAAADRLAKIGAQSGTTTAGFANVLDEVGAPPSRPPIVPSAAELLASERVAPRLSEPVDATKKAYQGLEALLLQNLVSTMLPQDSELFGEGSAGTIWRSMLAEQLGTSLSKQIDLGLEPRYLRTGHDHRAKTAEGAESLLRDVGHIATKHV